MQKTNRPEFEALVDRIAAGEVTRDQASHLAAAATGVSPKTFLSWIRSSGAAQRLRGVRGNVGTNNIHAHKDPDKVKAYEDAMALALSGKVSARTAALKYKVSYKWLLVKMKKAPVKDSAPARYALANEATVLALAKAVQPPYNADPTQQGPQ